MNASLRTVALMCVWLIHHSYVINQLQQRVKAHEAWQHQVTDILRRAKENHEEIVTAINEGRRLARKDEQ